MIYFVQVHFPIIDNLLILKLAYFTVIDGWFIQLPNMLRTLLLKLDSRNPQIQCLKTWLTSFSKNSKTHHLSKLNHFSRKPIDGQYVNKISYLTSNSHIVDIYFISNIRLGIRCFKKVVISCPRSLWHAISGCIEL